MGASWRESIIYGTVTFYGILYWLSRAIARYGGIPIYLSIPMVMLLSVYNGSYLAVFAHVYRKARNTPAGSILLALFFTTLEFVRSKLITGFPWGGPGVFVERPIEILQTASILGAVGCTFPVVLSNLLLEGWIRKKSPKYVVLGCLIPALMFSWGYLRIKSIGNTKTHKTLKIALCQPNIDQGVKWNRSYFKNTLGLLDRLVEKSKGSDFVVLPETSIPGFVSGKTYLGAFLEGLSKRTGTFLGAGALYRDKKGKIFNSFFLVSPKKGMVGRYDKIHLVPFGEFMPLSSKLQFLKKLGVSGNFSPGKEQKLFLVKGYKFGVLICFESIFPEISRKYVENGADFILNITNDGWFGNSPGPYQHFAFSRFRAVEEGVYFVRCANTGISGFISPSGEVIKDLGIGKRGTLTMDIPNVKLNTFYRRWGHLFPPASSVSLMLLAALTL